MLDAKETHPRVCLFPWAQEYIRQDKVSKEYVSKLLDESYYIIALYV
jgi:hypothetical protein